MHAKQPPPPTTHTENFCTTKQYPSIQAFLYIGLSSLIFRSFTQNLECPNDSKPEYAATWHETTLSEICVMLYSEPALSTWGHMRKAWKMGDCFVVHYFLVCITLRAITKPLTETVWPYTRQKNILEYCKLPSSNKFILNSQWQALQIT